MSVVASIIIRTYNEEEYLDELLSMIADQDIEGIQIETILVDSGSTDRTIEIATSHACRIEKIKKSDFTFGYSLNIGCDIARGKYLVFISGHCIPVDKKWLKCLLDPLITGLSDYCYGRQVGRDTTKFSENVHFEKTFPHYDKIPQVGYLCNNANAAISKACWEEYKFNETLTGLEDMHLAKRLVGAGKQVGYVACASVYHIHNETWGQVLSRYEREAYALQTIVPELHFSCSDFFHFFLSSLVTDFTKAKRYGCLIRVFWEIIQFRFSMYWGTYKGSKKHRELSEKMKLAYFYPKDQEKERYEKK